MRLVYNLIEAANHGEYRSAYEVMRDLNISWGYATFPLLTDDHPMDERITFWDYLIPEECQLPIYIRIVPLSCEEMDRYKLESITVAGTITKWRR